MKYVDENGVPFWYEYADCQTAEELQHLKDMIQAAYFAGYMHANEGHDVEFISESLYNELHEAWDRFMANSIVVGLSGNSPDKNTRATEAYIGFYMQIREPQILED